MYLDLIIKMITIYYILLYQFVNVSLPLYCISLALVLCIRTFLYRVFIKYCVFFSKNSRKCVTSPSPALKKCTKNGQPI